MDSMDDAIFVIDSRDIIEEVNKAATRLLNKSREHIINKKCYDVFPKNDQNTDCPLCKAHRTIKNEAIESEVVLLNRWFSIKTSPVHNKKGQVVKYIDTLRDISSLKKQQFKLIESEKRYKELAENTEAILWEYDILNDHWIYVAPQVERILGYHPDEWLNYDFWLNHIYIDDRQWAAKYCNDCTQRGESHIFEYRFIKKNQEVAWLRDVVSVIMENNHPVKLTGFMMDITDRKKTELQLEQKNSALQERVKELGCLYTISNYESDSGLSQEQFYKKVVNIIPPSFQHPSLTSARLTIIDKTFTSHNFKESKTKLTTKNSASGNKKCSVEVFVDASMLSPEDTVFLEEERKLLKAIEEQLSLYLTQKQSEQKIKDNEERLSLALKGSTDGVWDWNLGNNAIYFSPNWKRMLGYNYNELENSLVTWQKLMHPVSYKKVIKGIDQYLKHETTSFSAELKMKHKNGHWIHVLSRAISLNQTPDGKPYRVIGTHVDITRRKEHEKRLKKAFIKTIKRKKEINELLNVTRAIIKSNNLNDVIPDIYQSCKKVTKAETGIIGLISADGNTILYQDAKITSNKIGKETNNILASALRMFQRTGKPFIENNFDSSPLKQFLPERHIKINNLLLTPLWLNNKIIGLIALANKPTSFNNDDLKLTTAFADYTSIATKNENNYEIIKQRARELKKMNETKDMLFSVIGHDLKGPLQNIMGFSELISKKIETAPKEKIIKYQQIIRASAVTMSDLLNNLLWWAKNQSTTINIKPEKVNINQLTKTCFILFKINAAEKNIQLINNVPEHLLAFADKNMLHTVLRNLISNAIKFTSNGGKVEVGCLKNQDKLNIKVSDTGIGLNPEEITQILKNNNKTTTPGTNNEKGSGLGLMLCKDFISKNNGTLHIESQLGKGSVFSFSTPKFSENE